MRCFIRVFTYCFENMFVYHVNVAAEVFCEQQISCGMVTCACFRGKYLLLHVNVAAGVYSCEKYGLLRLDVAPGAFIVKM